jgi:hypothetical protein
VEEQYHNNFSCYRFVPRSDANYPVPTFRKKWPGSWMQEWFYVKVDLSQREDIKGIIQRPKWSHFGIRRPLIALGNDVQASQSAFNTLCTYIEIRDLVPEHIAYRVWPLANGWKMLKEAAAGSSQNGLVYLKYTFRYMSQFDEPNDGWLDAIEATSDELLGAYSKVEDEAMATTFGAWGKKRLNRVFDVIGFVYPDYCYPTRKQGKKRKAVTSTSSSVSRSKKIKVLTLRPRRIETAEVPKLNENVETSPRQQRLPCCAYWNYYIPGRRVRFNNRKSTKATEDESINTTKAAKCHGHSMEKEDGKRFGSCFRDCEDATFFFCRGFYEKK